MRLSRFTLIRVATFALMLVPPAAFACHPRCHPAQRHVRHRTVIRQRAVVRATYVQPAAYAVPAPYPPPVTYGSPQAATGPAATQGDPYGFMAWLNGVRASHGLPAVGYDPDLATWANANNAQQQSRGMGHHVMGPARRQNSAMGGYNSIGAMWMSSPAHQAALLDPTIRAIGIAGLGAYWTFNAR
jgi:uncharacterized protein YkwD